MCNACILKCMVFIEPPRLSAVLPSTRIESVVKVLVVQSFLTVCAPIAHQAPQSMGFHRRKFWTGLPFPSPRDLPNPGINPRSPALQVDSLPGGFPGGSAGKESTCQNKRCKRCEFDPWVGKIPWRRKWQPTLVFFPGKFHG